MTSMRFIPINSHIEIKPLAHQTFIASGTESYEEIGEVISIGDGYFPDLQVGDKVYFDSWMAAKYPKGDTGEFHWLVEYQHIRAVETERPEPINMTSTANSVNNGQL